MTQLVIDVVLGILVLAFCFGFPDHFFELCNRLGSTLHLGNLESKIHWLLGFPAGFKPNENMGIFIGNIVLKVIEKWNFITVALIEVRLAIVVYVSIFGIFGLSVQLAAVNDMLFLCSMWVFAIYSVIALSYHHCLQMMNSLYRLFRGKKFNVMRNRDDANNFSVSELFLGVMLITLCIFLLPTVAFFYYYAFLSIILSVLALQLCLIAAQTFLNDFPFYLVLLATF